MQIKSAPKPENRLWPEIISNTSADGILHKAMQNAACTLEKMVGKPMKVNGIQIETISADQMVHLAPRSEAEVAGVHLLTTDALPGRAILTLSTDDAMHLADWLLHLPAHTTTRLGVLEYSALAEIGNVVLSAFLNVVARFGQTTLEPSLPIVMVDSLANFLAVEQVESAEALDELIIIKTEFVSTKDSHQIQFWLLPDLTAPRRNQNKLD